MLSLSLSLTLIGIATYALSWCASLSLAATKSLVACVRLQAATHGFVVADLDLLWPFELPVLFRIVATVVHTPEQPQSPITQPNRTTTLSEQWLQID
jgi:hypothetical protein